MSKSNRTLTFKTLQKRHPVLIYESLNIHHESHGISIEFEFNLSDDFTFRPRISITLSSKQIESVNEEELQNLAFHIGMVELISYWKAACPPEVIIRPFHLEGSQINWWKKLWFYGLGEFFHNNGIDTGLEDFMTVSSTGKSIPEPFRFEPGNKVLVPVGGGKDSVVTLELMRRAGFEVLPFILNPREAGLRSVARTGFVEKDIFTVHRSIHPKLLELNSQGYLNGHTPFSALLAFVTLLPSRLNGIGNIALSNESSANEPTIPGTEINHQYSKSVIFEKDFRNYVQEYMCPDFNYFSFLRPLNELRIAKLFSEFPRHLPTFRSCNVGSKTDSWCGKCPKCLFTRIILGPFVDAEKMKSIFGFELLDDMSLQRTFDELTGMANEKPFECVGTVDEVNAALSKMIEDSGPDEMPALLRYYSANKKNQDTSFANLMKQFDTRHFLPAEFENVLKSALS